MRLGIFFKNYLTARSHGLFNEDRIKEVKIWKPGNHYQSHFNLHYSYDGIDDKGIDDKDIDDKCKVYAPNIPPPLNRNLSRNITLDGSNEIVKSDGEKGDIINRRNTEKPMVCECRQNTLTPAIELQYSIMEKDPVMNGNGGMMLDVPGGSKRRKKTKRRKNKKKTKRRKTKRKTNKGKNTKRR